MQFLYSREIEWHLFCKLLLPLTVLSMPKGCNSPVSTFEPALFWMISFFVIRLYTYFCKLPFVPSTNHPSYQTKRKIDHIANILIVI